MESSYGQPQLFLEILLVRRRSFFGTVGVIGHSVEFDDRPTAEIYFAQSFKDGGYVHQSVAQLDPSIGVLGVLPRKALDVFDVQKEQSIAELIDGFRGVAATLKIVRDIQFQFDVAGIRKTHDLVEFFGTLPERAHMIVISERDSEVSGALAELGESFGQLFEVCRSHSTALRAIVDYLEVESSRVAQKFGARSMFADALFRDSRVAEQVTAGKRHELQLVLAKQIAHRGGTAKLRDAVRAQLYAAKTDGGDVFDGLAIVAAPGDRCVAKMNFGRRGSDGRVEVREVHRRIKPFAREKRAAGKCRGRRQGTHCAEKLASRHMMRHESSFSSLRRLRRLRTTTRQRSRQGARAAIPTHCGRSTQAREIAAANTNRAGCCLSPPPARPGRRDAAPLRARESDARLRGGRLRELRERYSRGRCRDCRLACRAGAKHREPEGAHWPDRSHEYNRGRRCHREWDSRCQRWRCIRAFRGRLAT